jgi:tripartite-type tricarboxylate transporter receptor subunit TctC
VVASEAAAKATPDGYTLILVATGHALNPHLYPKLPYDSFADFTPISLIGTSPNMLLVRADSPYKTLGDLIADARAHPGQISYGHAGNGTSPHLAGELLKYMAKIDITPIPYKGGAPALADLIAGRIQFMFLSVSLTVPQVKQGKVKVIGVTGAKRSPELPNVPTTTEQGFPQVQALLFSSMLAPARTPDNIVKRMNEVVVAALGAPEVQKRLADLGAVPAPTSPEGFRKVLHDEGERWGKLIREKNIRAD